MFSVDEIKRASRVVKTATQIDPYTFNAGGYYNPSVKEMGWSQPQQPGFWGSLGKSVAGTAMRPFDFLRAGIGFAPGQSMLRNYGGPLAGGFFGKYLYHDPEMVAHSQARMHDGGIGWAAPYGRASEQSTQYMHALPNFLKTKPMGRFLLHPIETSHQWFKDNIPDRYP
jgi:hypothetical protein